MRLLVCGDRNFDNWKLLCSEMEKIIISIEVNDDLTIIEGEAKGADFLARVWAIYEQHPFEAYPADWNKFGKAAGPIRNKQMLDEGKPDKVLAFLKKGSIGTANMIKQAQAAGVPVIVVNI